MREGRAFGSRSPPIRLPIAAAGRQTECIHRPICLFQAKFLVLWPG
jgi:hypothetical protein